MRTTPSLRAPRALALAAAAALLLALVQVGSGPPASADTRPSVAGEPVTVSADPLPTVQIDGVVWSQVVVGTTVYAAGSFSTARPAGAAPGTSTVSRANLVAYDIRTGQLVTSWAPRTNAQVMAITASPDGSRLYIGGDFTQVNGAGVWRVAALDRATGALVTSFLPRPDYRVRAIVATASTVYLGGGFSAVGSSARGRLAAVRASDGGLLPWAPTAAGGSGVHAMVMSPDGSRLVVGGSFTSLNGSSNPGYGLAALSPSTGASLPFAVNSLIRNGGTNGAITSLSGDAGLVYGTGYTVGRAGGTLEGTFAATWDGALHWVEDCHGDTYSAWPVGDVVYQASHKHYCGNIGGFPQTVPWPYQHGTVVTRAVAGTATREQFGYTNYEGRPVPAMLAWYPNFQIGTYTGQNQGPWHVTAAGDHVVMGGEFRSINGVPQQGLVRFAVASVAPNRTGPLVSAGKIDLNGHSPSSGTVRVQWTANHDPDNRDLTYTLVRNSDTANPVLRQVQRSTWFQRPPMGFVDTGLPVGSTQRYRLSVADPYGNLVWSDSINVVVSGATAVRDAYGDAVAAHGATSHWRLGESSGARAYDAVGWNDMTVPSGVTRGTSGALASGGTAYTFDGTSAEYTATRTYMRVGDVLSLEAWFRTTSTRGGKILGFGDAATGDSILLDRHLYLDNGGRVFFGVRPAAALTVNSPSSYNNGQWHHVVGTLSPAGMRLYVDGVRVASRTDVTRAAPTDGYWRIGGDRLTGWNGQPSSFYLAGSIDEVAVYPRALTDTEVAQHNQLGRTTSANVAPTASFTATASGLTASLDGRGSSDPDGTVTAWSWDLGDGTTATGSTVTKQYASAGTRTVRLTVTDDDGAVGTTTRQVTVDSPPPAGVVATDTFSRTVTNGWGPAEVGGAWTTQGPADRFSVSSGAGRIRVPSAGTGGGAVLGAVSATSATTTAVLSLDRLPAGGTAFVSVAGRRVGTAELRAKVRVAANGSLLLYLVRTASGAETTLASTAVPGVLTAGEALTVRLELVGTSPTTLRATAWEAGTAPPTTPQLTATDTATGLQQAGSVGVLVHLASSTTAVPLTVAFDEVRVVAP
ncbi:LamG-like jellyroll fold domain-containing protein [Cellulomonas carbonis]|uniref:Radical SAM protein n=1 Tax=Cellulomonas carbonis T26 TaxID=947969 RepID=A0A0A0BSZ2_9CELL|nr:LamG-like jellyroll fold domain-containing protein [Cellulomonas carbonis]KGM11076.1 radical SAM protein [Cellulomonas carbonis T26]GGC16493.1 hypothetical protein GCM10010972_32270 [Cellulomonas carbonis]